MGYFDSSKNRALWEIRLGELRKERAAREAGNAGRMPQSQAERQPVNPSRVRVTYQQLLKAEASASGKEKRRESMALGRERTPERQKEAGAYEKSR